MPAPPPRPTPGAHQGHILISRLAALRIINDPDAPQGLRDFLKANMKYDMDACKKLATGEMVGGDADNYVAGLDGACTLPDRIQGTKEGREDLEPYGAPEGKMHFMDMEWLGKDPSYKPDLSNLPKVADISRDVKDPRWKLAGYVPFRVEEMYKKTVANYAQNPLNNEKALHDTGYLIHYIEDCTQPQHATIDFRSYSYLAGKVKQVHEVKTTTEDGKTVVSYRAEGRAINPHGDLEFQLFENDQEPRKTFRQDFWKELTARIDAKAKAQAAPVTTDVAKTPTPYGSFTRALEILSDSYQYLPAVGKAAAAAYASGKFGPTPFFTSEDTINGEKMNTVQLIAQRNADAVLEVEKTLRQAWADAHPKYVPRCQWSVARNQWILCSSRRS